MLKKIFVPPLLFSLGFALGGYFVGVGRLPLFQRPEKTGRATNGVVINVSETVRGKLVSVSGRRAVLERNGDTLTVMAGKGMRLVDLSSECLTSGADKGVEPCQPSIATPLEDFSSLEIGKEIMASLGRDLESGSFFVRTLSVLKE